MFNSLFTRAPLVIGCNNWWQVFGCHECMHVYTSPHGGKRTGNLPGYLYLAVISCCSSASVPPCGSQKWRMPDHRPYTVHRNCYSGRQWVKASGSRNGVLPQGTEITFRRFWWSLRCHSFIAAISKLLETTQIKKIKKLCRFLENITDFSFP